MGEFGIGDIIKGLLALSSTTGKVRKSKISKVIEELTDFNKRVKDKSGRNLNVSSNYIDEVYKQTGKWSKRRFNEQLNENYDAISTFWDNVYNPSNNPRTNMEGHLSKNDIAYLGLMMHGDLNTVVQKPNSFVREVFDQVNPLDSMFLSEYVFNKVVFRALQPLWQGSKVSDRWFNIMKRARKITGNNKLSVYDVVTEVFEQNRSMLSSYIGDLLDEANRYGWDSDSVSSIISAIVNSTNTVQFSKSLVKS